MSKPRPSALDAIKQKVRLSGNASAHASIIDTTIIEEDRKENSKPLSVEVEDQDRSTKKENVDVNVNVNDDNKPKKKKFEELHTRSTLWIKKEHIDRIEELCRGERGEKTRIINEALDEYFSKRKG